MYLQGTCFESVVDGWRSTVGQLFEKKKLHDCNALPKPCTYRTFFSMFLVESTCKHNTLNIHRFESRWLATPKRWRLVFGAMISQYIGVAPSIFPGGINWVVVSNIFYFHPYLGKWSNLTNIFQWGWFNHQLTSKPLVECCEQSCPNFSYWL